MKDVLHHEVQKPLADFQNLSGHGLYQVQICIVSHQRRIIQLSAIQQEHYPKKIVTREKSNQLKHNAEKAWIEREKKGLKCIASGKRTIGTICPGNNETFGLQLA